MGSSVQTGGEGDATLEIEKSDAFWSLELMGGGGDGVEETEVEGHFAQGLYGVGVEEDIAFAAGARDFLNGLDDTGFVVSGHEGDEGGVWPDCFEDRVGLNGSVRVGFDEGDVVAFGLKGLCGGEDGVVFDG
ncbi:MAG: hypothetical protein RIS92_1365 [Verrucomicrobiota bacterium]